MTSENIKANHELPTVSHLSKSDYSPAFHRRVQRLRLESWTSSFCSLPMFILLFKESHWIPNPMNKFSPKQQSGGVPALIPSHSRHTYTGPSTMPLKEICCGIAMWIMVGWLIFIKLREKEKYISKIKKTAFFFLRSLKSKSFWKKFLGRPQNDRWYKKPEARSTRARGSIWKFLLTLREVLSPRADTRLRTSGYKWPVPLGTTCKLA